MLENLSQAETIQLQRSQLYLYKLSSTQGAQEQEQRINNELSVFTINFYLEVNYNLKIKQMVKRGKYNLVNRNITNKHFPPFFKNKKRWEMKLILFRCWTSSLTALAVMNKLEVRPANALEILRFGEIHPNIQKEFPVVALGQIWLNNKTCYVIMLDKYGYKRRLSLGCFDKDWITNTAFLSVE